MGGKRWNKRRKPGRPGVGKKEGSWELGKWSQHVLVDELRGERRWTKLQVSKAADPHSHNFHRVCSICYSVLIAESKNRDAQSLKILV